ncbi:hypothetical protein CCYN49044_640011 [Capnocytophaga cynodegmi]|uniref:Uncharacterized protein n=1 Tax=Capnocytophaga cynodegmi TaxID=28189 RepID=A0A0B7HU77_9FLAO|nr:hypothetical protein CCYN74_320011 [Capnocytophaga cynodegmi]CEN42149.1 hypothetical protein CCYN49044_640011 [Capnocytophaga cynodegmi]
MLSRYYINFLNKLYQTLKGNKTLMSFILIPLKSDKSLYISDN